MNVFLEIHSRFITYNRVALNFSHSLTDSLQESRWHREFADDANNKKEEKKLYEEVNRMLHIFFLLNSVDVVVFSSSQKINKKKKDVVAWRKTDQTKLNNRIKRILASKKSQNIAYFLFFKPFAFETHLKMKRQEAASFMENDVVFFVAVVRDSLEIYFLIYFMLTQFSMAHRHQFWILFWIYIFGVELRIWRERLNIEGRRVLLSDVV